MQVGTASKVGCLGTAILQCWDQKCVDHWHYLTNHVGFRPSSSTIQFHEILSLNDRFNLRWCPIKSLVLPSDRQTWQLEIPELNGGWKSENHVQRNVLLPGWLPEATSLISLYPTIPMNSSSVLLWSALQSDAASWPWRKAFPFSPPVPESAL